MKRAACDILDQLIRIEEKDGLAGVALILWDFGNDVGYVCEFATLFFGFFDFLFIFGGLYKEVGFGVFGSIGKEGVN